MALLEQTLIATKANLLSRYRQSWAGFIWVSLNPLLTLFAQTFVFYQVLKSNIPNYHVYLYSGLLPWLFLTQTLEMTAMIFVYQGRVIKSYQVNPMVFLGAQALDNFINFNIVFFLVSFFALFNSQITLLGFGMAIIAMIPLLAATFGLSFLFASMTVFYRDIKFVINFMMTIIYFLTPIFYHEKDIAEEYRWIIYLNPLYKLMRPIRIALLEGEFSVLWFQQLASSCAVAFCVIVLALLYWKRRRNEVTLYV